MFVNDNTKTEQTIVNDGASRITLSNTSRTTGFPESSPRFVHRIRGTVPFLLNRQPVKKANRIAILQIEWDQNAAPVRNAHLGAIDVKDNGETKRYPLADEALHSGRMPYVRHGGDLEIRMTVYPVGFSPVQQFAHFLDPGPIAPPGAPPEIEKLRKERDQLEAQVNQLKEDLRKERTSRRRKR